MTRRNTVQDCIYCGARNVEGSREHVVPDAFGQFTGSLTLVEAVCTKCNQVFGDTIDRALARTTPEGLERYFQGVKSPGEIAHFDARGLTVRVPRMGEFVDALVQLERGPPPSGVRARLVPAVWIKRTDGEEWVEFREEEIESGAWRNNPVDWRRGVKVYAEGPDLDRLTAIVDSQGIRPTNKRELPLPDQQAETDLRLTLRVNRSTIERAVAKIALNYLAHRCGPAYVLGPAFDEIRRFVRYGDAPSFPPVRSDWELPYRTDLHPDQRPLAHFIGLVADPTNGSLNGIVSLLGMMSYTVTLSRVHFRALPVLPLAHFYNIKTRRCDEFPSSHSRTVPLILPRPRV